jgi:hypothetical protein
MIAFFASLVAFAQVHSTPPPCNPREAVRTTVVEIGRNPERFVDRCVTVTGAFAGIRMYSRQEGMYLLYRFARDGNQVAAHRVHLIGIDNQDMRDLRMRFPQRTTVTGRVDTCERRYERIRAAGGFPFLAGYCHYESGPTILVDRYSITEQSYGRMMGEEARRRFGNLIPMPEDWPNRSRVEAVAAEFLAALRARDRTKIRELHDIRDERNEHDRGVLSDLLESRYSVFTQVRDRSSSQIAMFVIAAEDDSPLGRGDERPNATVCFCRTDDCSGRWPIAINDANNEPARPYACIGVEPREGTRGGAQVETPIRGGWLREPSGTAFRS